MGLSRLVPWQAGDSSRAAQAVSCAGPPSPPDTVTKPRRLLAGPELAAASRAAAIAVRLSRCVRGRRPAVSAAGPTRTSAAPRQDSADRRPQTHARQRPATADRPPRPPAARKSRPRAPRREAGAFLRHNTKHHVHCATKEYACRRLAQWRTLDGEPQPNRLRGRAPSLAGIMMGKRQEQVHCGDT